MAKLIRQRKGTLSQLARWLSWPLNAAAAPFDIAFSLPGLGRLVKWVLSVAQSLLHLLAGAVEYGLMKAGVFPYKRMTLGVVILRDEQGQALTEAETLVPHIQAAIDVLYDTARVKLIPVPPIVYDADQDGRSEASAEWVLTDPRPATKAMLDVHCNATAFSEDLWVTGALYQILTVRNFLYTNFRRLLGYGSAVICIVVRDIDRHGGCSVGPLSDYVTLAHNVPYCLAHELGHACNLLHQPELVDNLMHPVCGKTALTEWQIALLRASRHVTFF
jgi:hypothetical protein